MLEKQMKSKIMKSLLFYDTQKTGMEEKKDMDHSDRDIGEDKKKKET